MSALSLTLIVIMLTLVLVSGIEGVTGKNDYSLGAFASVLANGALNFGFFTPNIPKLPAYNENDTDNESDSSNLSETESEWETESETEAEESSFSDTESVTETESEDVSETDGNTESESDCIIPDGAISVVELDMCERETEYGDVINNTNASFDLSILLGSHFDSKYTDGSPYPLVLVIHTHTSEGYSENGVYYDPDRDGDIFRGVVGIGDRVVNTLISNRIPTLHCTVIHDGDGNADSYVRAEESIKAMLEMYPTVKYIIDLHRTAETDGMGNVIATRGERGELSPAQIRMTVSAGEDERVNRNMSLALKLKEKLNRDGNNICRPIVASPSAHNSAYSRYYLTLDVGSCGNTYKEACIAADIFSACLTDLIKGIS